MGSLDSLISSISLIGPRGNTISVAARGSGPTLFLLHGFPLDHRMWRHQLESLSQYYHVVAPELRGFGGSTLDAGYTLRELADDIEFVRQHLAGGQPIHLCGLSMGGYVAFEYWHVYRTNLQSLTLLNTKPAADDDAGKRARTAMADKAQATGTWSAVEPMMEKVLSPNTRERQSDVFQLVETMMRGARPEAIAAAQHAMAERRDFTPLLGSMRLPVLVVTGSHDPIAPPAATQEWSSLIPGAIYECLEEAAHLTPLERPEAINGLLMKLG